MSAEGLLNAPLAGLGAVAGSFFNVVIHRVPAKQSVVAPRSHCPSCATPLGAVDLVPVLSWVLLRGRCRHCAARISARYPIVELLSAASFAIVGWRVGLVPALPAYLLLTGFLVVLSAIDIDTTTLPRRLIYACSVAGGLLLLVATAVDGTWHRVRWALVGVAGTYAAFRALYAVARGGLGYGDVRLATMLGGYLGWWGMAYVPVGIFTGFVLGAAVGTALLVARRASRRSALPFGPFLAGGALLTIVAGSPLVDALWWVRP